MYGKFFASTFTGSMLGTSPVVFAVWGYVVANAVSSTVELNPGLLAYVLNCPESDVLAAIEYLCSPDPKSRDKSKDGRRLIREGEYQYHVVTWEKYNQIRNEEQRREYNRVKQQESRARRRALLEHQTNGSNRHNEVEDEELKSIKPLIPNEVSNESAVSNLSKLTVNDGQAMSAMSAHIEEEEEEEEDYDKKSDARAMSKTLIQVLKETTMKPPGLEEADWHTILGRITEASTKTVKARYVHHALLDIAKKWGVESRIPEAQALRYLVDKMLEYYRLVRSTWAEDQWRYAKGPEAFLREEIWRQNPVLWDRTEREVEANGHSEGLENTATVQPRRRGRPSIADRNAELARQIIERDLGRDGILPAIRSDSDGAGPAAGTHRVDGDAPDDVPGPRSQPGSIADLFRATGGETGRAVSGGIRAVRTIGKVVGHAGRLP